MDNVDLLIDHRLPELIKQNMLTSKYWIPSSICGMICEGIIIYLWMFLANLFGAIYNTFWYTNDTHF